MITPSLSLLEKAIALAVEAHRGQKDRAGAPYILHPLRMMARVESVPEKIVVSIPAGSWTRSKQRRVGSPFRAASL